MSLRYRNNQGTETPVAGLNGTSGELVPSVALQQSGTGNTDTISVGSYVNKEITFTTPMPDTDYVINFNTNSVGGILFTVMSKTVSSFVVNIWNVNDRELAVTFTWTAFKLMTDTVHEADSAHIAQNTANFAPAFSEVTSYAVGDYVTYNNVLYRCTTAHTAGVWVAGHFTQVTVGERLKPLESFTTISTLAQDATFEAGITATDLYARQSGRVVQLNFNWAVVSTSKSAYNPLLTFSERLPAPNTTVFIPTVDVDTGTPYMLYLTGRELHCRTAINGSNSPVHLVGACTYISA